MTHRFKTSQEAYIKLNREFLNCGGISAHLQNIVSGQVVAYDTTVIIDKAWVDPDFDFGNTFGYRDQKWKGLKSNYIDEESLSEFNTSIQEKEAKGSKHYNISMPFANNHAHGKNCLLCLTATRRPNIEKPILSFTLRSSEITKRLLMDLLLVQRIGEYVYGEEQDISLKMDAINMYQDPEAFCMLDSVYPIKDMLVRKKGERKSWYQKKIIKILKRLKTVDIDEVKYKVHKRCVRQLQRPNGYPLSGDRPMYTKELKL